MSGAANLTPSGPVASSREGIAHNYAGPLLLADQRFDPLAFVASPGGLLALFAAPLLLAGVHGALATAPHPAATAAARRLPSRTCAGP